MSPVPNESASGLPGLSGTRAAAVADELRRLILSGELEPGARLRQVELAERFKVSTTPVREAFTALAKVGLVQHDAQRGVVVFSPSIKDIAENYEIRIALEPLATELAARHVSDAEVRRINEIVSEMRAAADDKSTYQQLNRAFHHEIYAAARRPRLLEIIESLRDASEAYIRFDFVSRPDPQFNEDAHRQHEAIADAVSARDPETARALMEEHLIENAHHIERSV
jgi:DNA-binding GntR family transcriptional regulator